MNTVSYTHLEDSVEIWNKLHDAIPNNDYVTQQLAFAIYKAKKHNATIALQKTLEVIMTLAPNTALDLETLGITGAIYKRLYKVNNNFDYLEEAIKMYQRGYTIRNDYYTGENYANCLLFKTKKEGISACLLYTSSAFMIGFGISAVIEVSQLIFRRGVFEWDDMIHNSLGCMIGCIGVNLWLRWRKN